MVMSYIKDVYLCIYYCVRVGMYHIHLGCIYLPGERFTSTNDGSISSNCYREIKFSAKVTFILLTGVHPSIFIQANNKSIW